MSSTIKIQYSLNPPEGVNPGDKSTSKSHQFKIDTSANSKGGEDGKLTSYYEALRIALEEARSQIGDELTAWKDCVGKLELNKEPVKKGNGDEEVEEEEEGNSVGS